MGLFSGKNSRMPADVRATLGIENSQRVLAWAPLARGRGHLALTGVALHVAISGEPALTVPWEQVAHAMWEDPILTAVVDVDGRQLRIAVELPEPGAVPVVLRERVTTTVLWECHRMLSEGHGARFIARRPAGAGPVRWSVLFDEAVDAENPALAAQADVALVELRADLGL